MTKPVARGFIQFEMRILETLHNEQLRGSQLELVQQLAENEQVIEALPDPTVHAYEQIGAALSRLQQRDKVSFDGEPTLTAAEHALDEAIVERAIYWHLDRAMTFQALCRSVAGDPVVSEHLTETPSQVRQAAQALVRLALAGRLDLMAYVS